MSNRKSFCRAPRFFSLAALGAALAALCLALPGAEHTAGADGEGAWLNASGEQVASGTTVSLSSDAYYGEKLDPTRLQATVTPEPGEGGIQFAFLRDKQKTPDIQGNVRGLYFCFERDESGVSMSVLVVNRDSVKTCLEDYSVSDSVAIDVRTTEGGSVVLYADGKRLIRDFAEVTEGVLSTAYSAANVSYAAVKCGEDGGISIESLSDGGTAVSFGDEWIYENSAQTYSLPATLDKSARLTAGQFSQNLCAVISSEEDFSLSFTKNILFRKEDGAQGFKLEVKSSSEKYVVSAFFLRSKNQTALFENFLTETDVGSPLSVRLRAKLDGGFVLELGGERVLIAGKDPLSLFSAEDFSDGLGKTFLAFECEGRTEIKEIVGAEYDEDPIGRVTDAVNESEIGNTAEQWSGDATMDEKGVAHIAGNSALNKELSVDYVGFTMDIANLVSTSVADCGISFAVAATNGLENGETGASGANGIVFFLKNKSGTLNLAVYERYGNNVRTIIGDTPLLNVNVYASLRFELVWYDYELRLFINGNEFVNEYGINPLESHYPKYYRNENKKTFLCFSQSLSAEDKPLLTPQNATRFCIYNIENILPMEYRTAVGDATADEAPEKGLQAAVLWTSAAVAAGAGVLLFSIVAVCIRRRHAPVKSGKKNHKEEV